MYGKEPIFSTWELLLSQQSFFLTGCWKRATQRNFAIIWWPNCVELWCKTARGRRSVEISTQDSWNACTVDNQHGRPTDIFSEAQWNRWKMRSKRSCIFHGTGAKQAVVFQRFKIFLLITFNDLSTRPWLRINASSICNHFCDQFHVVFIGFVWEKQMKTRQKSGAIYIFLLVWWRVIFFDGFGKPVLKFIVFHIFILMFAVSFTNFMSEYYIFQGNMTGLCNCKSVVF